MRQLSQNIGIHGEYIGNETGVSKCVVGSVLDDQYIGLAVTPVFRGTSDGQYMGRQGHRDKCLILLSFLCS